MKVRLFDIIDLSRPLAKAARDFDWTEVVKLFPEAHHDGLTASKIWVLASLVVLSEVTGLSEGEVLSRWPENPYWQVFSGFEQFQWKTPVTAGDCLAFRRFITPERASRLSKIAKSIREAKPIDEKVTSSIPVAAGSSGDEVLALRQVHFSQPMPAAPYKAPPRPDFNSGVKHAYARSASIVKAPGDTPQADPVPASAAPTTPGDAANAASPTPGPEAGKEGTTTTDTPKADSEDSVKRSSEQGFPQTYTQMFRGKVVLPMESPKPLPKTVLEPQIPTFGKPSSYVEAPAPKPEPVVAPKPSATPTFPPAKGAKLPAQPPQPPAQAPVLSPFGGMPSPLMPDPFKIHQGASPQFDTTSPLVLRAPPGEPIRMEVNAAGEGPMEYQWEQWDDAKGVSIPIEGCTDSSLTVALEPEDSMLAFQCRVFNAAAPEGVISRTFFLKKSNAAPKPQNSFGEKFDPKMFISGI